MQSEQLPLASTAARVFLSPIHTFRGIAVLLVVAYHCLTLFVWQGSALVHDAILDLVANSTVLFVFVSGYLFQHLSQEFSYRRYLARKMEHVVAPYLIVAFPAVLYTAVLHDPITDYPFLAGTSLGYELLYFYVSGNTQINYPLWFIPVIGVFFLLSFAFHQMVRRPLLYTCLVVLLPVALLAHRPNFPNPNLFHSVLYFMPVYVLGMFASQYREQIDPWLDRYLGLLTLAFVALLVAHVLLAGHHGNYNVHSMFSFEQSYIDWALLQKIALSFVLLGLLNRYDRAVAGAFRLLGSTAFRSPTSTLRFEARGAAFRTCRCFALSWNSW